MTRPFVKPGRGVFVSTQAELGVGVHLGTGVKIYGRARVGNDTWIDAGVVIGYPAPDEIRAARTIGRGQRGGLDELFDSVVTRRTELGSDSLFRSGTVIYSGTRIGDRCDCAHHVVVREGCDLAADVDLGPFAYLKRACVVGDQSRVAAELCDRTVVGKHCTVYGRTAHKFLSGVSGHIEDAPTLHDGVVIGREAVLVGGLDIGELAYVGAGAVVTASVEAETVVAGNPARVVRRRSQEEAPELWARVKAERPGSAAPRPTRRRDLTLGGGDTE